MNAIFNASSLGWRVPVMITGRAKTVCEDENVGEGWDHAVIMSCHRLRGQVTSFGDIISDQFAQKIFSLF